MSFSRRLLSVAAVCGAAAVTAFAGPAASASDADDDDVISGLPLGGPTAAQVLEVLNLEDRYAATVDVSGEELLDLLRTENGLFLAEDGLLGYAEPAMPSAATETAIPTNTAAATATADDAFALNSSPEAASTIFLDFDGAEISDDYWNRTYNVGTISAGPYDIDGDPDSFSASELTNIVAMWEQVAEDFSAFNVNVTTEDPGAEALQRNSFNDTTYGTRVVITSTDWFREQTGTSIGGIALVNVFSSVNDYSAWVFSGNFFSPSNIANAISHEAGHTLGLLHDGKGSNVYYAGGRDWGPIMGAPYTSALTQWSNGSYSGATNPQDDIVTIAAYTGFIDDDHGNDVADATLAADAQTVTGVIGYQDVDTFALDVSGSAGSISTVSATLRPSRSASNLRAEVALYSSAGELLNATTPPDGSLNATVSATVPPGRYVVAVRGAGNQNAQPAFSSYSSFGSYDLQLSVGASRSPFAVSAGVDTAGLERAERVSR